jgi:hypothetical protein
MGMHSKLRCNVRLLVARRINVLTGLTGSLVSKQSLVLLTDKLGVGILAGMLDLDNLQTLV